jgi:NAD+ dependent glucose-6-phosphate dehydrogenase
MTAERPLTVVVTGAAGNLGSKLCAHLRNGGYSLRPVDIDPRGDGRILTADLSMYDVGWTRLFDGADAVVHFAGNPSPYTDWSEIMRPNVDGVLNVYLAASEHAVKRVVLASSIWAVASQFESAMIPGADPSPGTNPYGAAKLFAERVGKAFAETHGISTVALRIGRCCPGTNDPSAGTGAWEEESWLSNRDMCQGVERALRLDATGFSVANLTSRNRGSRWSLAEAETLLGYEPSDSSVPHIYVPRQIKPVASPPRKRGRIFSRLLAKLSAS